jgi:hypothetical protein
LARTIAPPIFSVSSVVPAVAVLALEGVAVGVLAELPELDEPPQAATTSAVAVSPAGASHLLRIACLRSQEIFSDISLHVASGHFDHLWGEKSDSS